MSPKRKHEPTNNVSRATKRGLKERNPHLSPSFDPRVSDSFCCPSPQIQSLSLPQSPASKPPPQRNAPSTAAIQYSIQSSIIDHQNKDPPAPSDRIGGELKLKARQGSRADPRSVLFLPNSVVTPFPPLPPFHPAALYIDEL